MSRPSAQTISFCLTQNKNILDQKFLSKDEKFMNAYELNGK